MSEKTGPARFRAAAALAAELGDPVRITVIELLASGGGVRTASQLTDEVGIAPPRLANHLARLRRAGIVAVTRSGRHALYRLTDPRVAEAVTALAVAASAAGCPPAGQAPRADSPLAQARSCYDHLAGRLGVAVFDHLVAVEAIRVLSRADDSQVMLGPAAAPGFAALGVDVTAPLPRRRKHATICLDWTERRPHLGGALGAAVLDSALASGWVRRAAGRALTVTAAGREHLPVPWHGTAPAGPGGGGR